MDISDTSKNPPISTCGATLGCNGRGHVVLLRFLEWSSLYGTPSTMPYNVWLKYGQIEQGYYLEW
jgi:hypothetical protein